MTIKQGAFDERYEQPTGRRISTDQGNIGYIELRATGGWIVDLRRNNSGNIWSYIAAIGPILGEGKVGGFIYRFGKDSWKYEDGKVFWGSVERFEDLAEGPIYKLKHPMPPIAILMSRATIAAAERAVATFQGRPKVRTFGQATGGSPFLQNHTTLSNGAFLSVSGACSDDRTGRIYKGSITPDEIGLLFLYFFPKGKNVPGWVFVVALAATIWTVIYATTPAVRIWRMPKPLGFLILLGCGIYVLVVGILGTAIQERGNLLISILATGLVAVLVQPLRDRLQRGVNRMMYGERDDPVTVLSRLGQQKIWVRATSRI